MEHTCRFCRYTARESDFLEGECPACCRDLETGEENKNSIPQVFHEPALAKGLDELIYKEKKVN